MTDLSSTVAAVLSSSLADPAAIAITIQEAERDLQSLETQLAEAEGRALSDATAEAELEPLAVKVTGLTMRVRRRAASLDKLRAAHAEAIKARDKAAREEHKRRVLSQRDAVIEEVQQRYPLLAGELAQILDRVAHSTAECTAVGVPGPESAGRLTPLVRYACLPPLMDKGGQVAFWPPARPRSTVEVLPRAAMERSAEIGAEATATMQANLRRESQIRGIGPADPEAERVA